MRVLQNMPRQVVSNVFHSVGHYRWPMTHWYWGNPTGAEGDCTDVNRILYKGVHASPFCRCKCRDAQLLMLFTDEFTAVFFSRTPCASVHLLVRIPFFLCRTRVNPKLPGLMRVLVQVCPLVHIPNARDIKKGGSGALDLLLHMRVVGERVSSRVAAERGLHPQVGSSLFVVLLEFW